MSDEPVIPPTIPIIAPKQTAYKSKLIKDTKGKQAQFVTFADLNEYFQQQNGTRPSPIPGGTT